MQDYFNKFEIFLYEAAEENKDIKCKEMSSILLFPKRYEELHTDINHKGDAFMYTLADETEEIFQSEKV